MMRTHPLTFLCMLCISSFLYSQDNFENIHNGYSDWSPPDKMLVGPSNNDLAYAEKHLALIDTVQKSITKKEIAPPSGIPECPPPLHVNIIPLENKKALVEWKDIETSADGTQYQVRFRNKGKWEKRIAIERYSITIELSDPVDNYEFEVRKLCGGKGNKFEMSSKWVPGVPITRADDDDNDEDDCTQFDDLNVQLFNQDSITFNFTDNQLNYLDSNNYCIGIFITYCGDTTATFQILCPTIGQLNYVNIFNDRSGGGTTDTNNIENNICDISYSIIQETNDPNNNGLPLGQWSNNQGYGISAVGDSYHSVCPARTLFSTSTPNGQVYGCPEDFDIPAATGTSQLAQASAGDIFIINGHSVELTSVSGSDGTFSGRGSVYLPFQRQALDVEFTDISVDEDYIVFNGEMTGIIGPSEDYPDLSGGITYDGNYCVEIDENPNGSFDENGVNSATGLGWDPNGFGPDSTYTKVPPYPGWVEGDPIDPNYDPNGFNAGGIHKETGTKYNPNGCDAQGLDVHGQPCSPEGDCPYYWLTDCADQTDEGLQFADSIAHELGGMIINLLELLQDKNNDSLQNKLELCANLREQMNELVGQLQYDRKFVFGEEDLYFKKDMHKYFADRPKPFATNVSDRNPKTIALENQHVQLYGCDLARSTFISIHDIIDEQLLPDQITVINARLINLIKRLDANIIQSFISNPEAFSNWIKEELKKIIIEEYDASQNDDTGYHLPKIKHELKTIKSPGYKYSNSIGSESLANNNPNSFLHSTEDLRSYQKFVAQEIANGKQWINQIHKASYMDGLAKNKLRRLAMIGGDDIENTLPIIMRNEVAGLQYTIVLDHIILRPTDCILDATILIIDPFSGQRMAFNGENIHFNPGGLTSSEESRLKLVTDTEMKLANNILLRLIGGENTYVTWNCNGFAAMSVQAEVEFCREMLIPLDPITMAPIPNEEARVTAYFFAEMPAWGQFMAEISIEPFAVKGAEQIGWEVYEAQIDFNELGSFNFTTPELYTSPHIDDYGVPTNAWKGFRLGLISATLPRKIQSNQGSINESVTVGAHDLIIDSRGFTGVVFVTNILPLSEGNADGWAFSIDTFQLSVVQNQLTGGGMSGLINIPIMKGLGTDGIGVTHEDCLVYRASMQSSNVFSFDVSPKTDLAIPLWKSTVHLYSDSKIEMELRNDSFNILATLHGGLDVNASLSPSIGVEINGLNFENVQLSNHAPFFSPGTWSMPSEGGAQIGGFKLGISQVGLYKDSLENSVSLNFSTKIKITDGEKGIGADGKFRLTGDLEITDEGRQKWKFNTFHVDGLNIDACIKENKIRGGLVFFGKDNPDPVYGVGFRGVLGVKFAKIDVLLAAVAQFGTKSDYKYFMVDAIAKMDPGIEFGTFKLHGFGGGLYHHMRPTNESAYFLEDAPGVMPPISAVDLGKSISNEIYVPDNSKGLGLKAIVMISSESENVFSANATFEILFNSSTSGGGVSFIQLKGNGRLMADFNLAGNQKSTPGKRPNDALLSANVDIKFDFDNHVFDGSLEVFLNAGEVLTGVGPDGKMVDAAIHFSKNKWFINIGRPDSRAGIQLLNLLEVNAYLCVGNDIPDMPALPEEVRRVTGTLNHQESERQTGTGFAFGASLELGPINEQFLIFTGNLHLILGFDVMVKDYGETAICAHNNQQIGINGWYASGQVYAYVEAGIGVKAFNKTFEILNLQAGAVLQARLPNPFWAAGAVGGKYRILGGLVKGECRFQFEIGERCQIIGTENPELAQEYIQTISPGNNVQEVSVASVPEISFTVPMENSYDIEGINGGTDSYLANLAAFEVLHNGSPISGDTSWIKTNELNEKWVAKFKPQTFFPGGDSLIIKATVEVFKNGSLEKTEVKEHKIYTTDRPNYIPFENIKATYPIDGMNNFYKNEWSEKSGYIQLNIGQAYLFTGEKKPVLKLYHTPKLFVELNYEYNANNKEIKYEIPSSILNNGQLYNLQLVFEEKETEGGEIEDDSSSILPGYGSSATSTLSTSNSQDVINDDVLYESFFRVSNYSTFSEKINTVQFDVNSNYLESINYKFNISEPLDNYECNQLLEAPLIKMEVDKLNNPWIKQRQNEILYNPNINYHMYQALALDIYYNIFEFRVLRGTKFSSSFNSIIDRKTFINGDDISFHGGANFYSNLTKEIKDTYLALKQQIMIYYSSQGSMPPPNWTKEISDYHLRDDQVPPYINLKLSYYLPGKSQPTSTVNLKLQ